MGKPKKIRIEIDKDYEIEMVYTNGTVQKTEVVRLESFEQLRSQYQPYTDTILRFQGRLNKRY